MAPANIASSADLKPNEKKAVEVNGAKVLLVNLNGTYYAIGDKCTHRGCSLSKGTINGDTLQCACHGSTFNLKTGEVVKGPAKNPEPKYNVKVENNQVLISA
jgi:3-phenylpropionate/trans-cinnamate dioxygenase ferredoxin subunit